jgi:hypothetical protein
MNSIRNKPAVANKRTLKHGLFCAYATICLFTFVLLGLETRLQSTDMERRASSFAELIVTTLSPDQVPVVHRSNQSLSVISYSLYGNGSAYVWGMVETAKQDYTVYPDWEVRVYHNNEVPADILSILASLKHVRLVNVVQEFPAWVANQVNPMCWRFLVASDPAVRAYAIRDSDSRPSIREKAAVDEWIRSGMAFHIMRDHPAHNSATFAAILGGMWGGLGSAVPNMKELLWEYYCKNNTEGVKQKHEYKDDQDFLWKYVLPLATNNCLQHDSYYCDESGGIAFPMSREEAGSPFDFVGNSFNYMVETQGGIVVEDVDMSRDGRVSQYMKCLEIRNNFTNFLEKTRGSSKILPGTPYKGRSDKSSTELLAEQIVWRRKQRQILARDQRKAMRKQRKVGNVSSSSNQQIGNTS